MTSLNMSADPLTNWTFNSSDPSLVATPSPPSWFVLFLFFFVVAGAFGNLLVCLAIKVEVKLHNVTNYFLFSLAITDMLVSVVVMPLSIVKHLYGEWPHALGWVTCSIWVFADVLLCTSSILHLSMISVDRFVAIADPLRARAARHPWLNVRIKICFTWILSATISSPVLVLGIIHTENVMKPIEDGSTRMDCVLSNNHFTLYGSIFAFVIPLIIMIVTYILTLRQLQGKEATIANEKRSLSQQPDRPLLPIERPAAAPRVPRIARLLVPPAANSTEVRHPEHSPSRWRRIPGQSHFEPADPVQSNPAREESSCSNSPPSSADSGDLEFPQQKFRQAVRQALLLQRVTRTLQENTNSRRHTAVQNEKKASKVLGIVFAVFVVAWAPFCVVNMLSAACSSCMIAPLLVNFLVWLGYVSSTVNPLIYTIFNQTYRHTFRRLLTGQVHASSWTNRNTSSVQTSTGSCAHPSSPLMLRQKATINSLLLQAKALDNGRHE